MSRGVGLYILKMYTGLKNKVIGEIFGVSLSAVNKAALRVSTLRKKQKDLEERIEKIVYSRCVLCKANTGNDYYHPVLNCFSFKRLVDFT
jgi:hypothetical protein